MDHTSKTIKTKKNQQTENKQQTHSTPTPPSTAEGNPLHILPTHVIPDIGMVCVDCFVVLLVVFLGFFFFFLENAVAPAHFGTPLLGVRNSSCVFRVVYPCLIIFVTLFGAPVLLSYLIFFSRPRLAACPQS
jgi:hypothetical protein